jgi:protein-tyrosine phosphatase
MCFFHKNTISFKNWIDYHCHILPGVDDGVKTMDQSLAILKRYEEEGVKAVWFTPHIMEDVPNTTAALRSRFEELKAAYSGPLSLHLGAEYMLDNLFVKRLSEKDILPVYGGNMLLVETSYFRAPADFEKIIADIKSAGFSPVLAHPERYLYMSHEQLRLLHEQGIMFQMNVPSLAGHYGMAVRSQAKWLLRKGYYNYQGSDLHSAKGVNFLFKQ